MKALVLNAKYRNEIKHSQTKAIRRNGGATGTIYGHSASPVSIEVDIKDLVALAKEAKETDTTFFQIKVDGAPENVDGAVLIKNVHKNPLTKKIVDVEFQRVSMNEKITVTVPIEFVGEPAGVALGGILEELTTELHIRALPNNLPTKLDVNISDLQVGQHLNVSDLALPDGVEVINDADTGVVSCVQSHQAASEETEETAESTETAE